MQTAIVDRGKHEGVRRVRVAFVYFASCGGKGGRGGQAQASLDPGPENDLCNQSWQYCYLIRPIYLPSYEST
jgi:hypothetical protein